MVRGELQTDAGGVAVNVEWTRFEGKPGVEVRLQFSDLHIGLADRQDGRLAGWYAVRMQRAGHVARTCRPIRSHAAPAR
jgi:hypothetical protein